MSKSTLFTKDLLDASLTYMEGIEYISKLREKDVIKQIGPLKIKLKKMLEVPIQFYQILTRLKEGGSNSSTFKKKSTEVAGVSLIESQANAYQMPSLKKRMTSDILPPSTKLERSYSELANSDTVNFIEVMT